MSNVVNPERESLVMPEAAMVDEQPGHQEEEQPRATFVLLLFYLILTAGLWGSVYLMLWNRR